MIATRRELAERDRMVIMDHHGILRLEQRYVVLRLQGRDVKLPRSQIRLSEVTVQMPRWLADDRRLTYIGDTKGV
jgi:hypothetical protein